MKALVVIVSATLTVAILLTGALLIATSTRGKSVPAGKISLAVPYSPSQRTFAGTTQAI